MHSARPSLVVAAIAGGILASGSTAYLSHILATENAALKQDFAETRAEYAQNSKTLLENIEALKILLGARQAEREVLEQDLRNEREIVDSIEAQVAQMTSTVGTLEKLRATDRELLKKYSRIYFLNENYLPQQLLPVPAAETAGTRDEKYFHAQAWPFLERLLNAARADGMELRILSAYRSFGTQAALKSAYAVRYGSGANQFSADQGYSEHQLGTTIDFTTAKLGTNFTSFEKTPEYVWLTKNAHRFGFTLSYPNNNRYYVFEPWHWRFVGHALAEKLFADGKHFYDLTQREIDEYLVSIFDE